MGNRMSIYRVGRPNNVVELARRHVLVAACGRHVPKAAPAVCPSTRASCLSHHFTCKLLLLTTKYFITPMTLWHIRLIFRSENSSNTPQSDQPGGELPLSPNIVCRPWTSGKVRSTRQLPGPQFPVCRKTRKLYFRIRLLQKAASKAKHVRARNLKLIPHLAWSGDRDLRRTLRSAVRLLSREETHTSWKMAQSNQYR